VKIRLLAKPSHLRHLSLDGTDMFLISRLDGEVSLGQLMDVSPCGPMETMHRIRRLAKLQVVECEDAFASDEPKTLPSRRSLGLLAKSAPTFEEANTLRPPRPTPKPQRLAEERAAALLVDHVFAKREVQKPAVSSSSKSAHGETTARRARAAPSQVERLGPRASNPASTVSPRKSTTRATAVHAQAAPAQPRTPSTSDPAPQPSTMRRRRR
jgi:hypothetical protein